jgi:hypothetical protein
MSKGALSTNLVVAIGWHRRLIAICGSRWWRRLLVPIALGRIVTAVLRLRRRSVSASAVARTRVPRHIRTNYRRLYRI